jgi:hypothetical protein
MEHKYHAYDAGHSTITQRLSINEKPIQPAAIPKNANLTPPKIQVPLSAGGTLVIRPG